MKAVLILVAWVVALTAAPVRIYDANVQDAGGNPANGRLEVQLSAPCTDVGTGRTYTQQKLTVPVAAGVVDVSLQPTTACRQLNVWYEVIYILSNDSERRRRVWRVPQSGAPHLVSVVEYEAPPAWGIPIGPKLTRTDQGLDLAPGVLDASYFANNAISNAKLADMAAATLKGNNTGGTADPLDLTVAQVKTMLGYSAADLSNGVSGSGSVVLATSPTLVTPVIASLANANHSHQNAAGGGTLDGAAIATGTIDVGRISQAAVTQHQAALSIATSQLTGTLADARVAQSNITQHQAALTIAESQVTGLAAALAGKSAIGHTHSAGDTIAGTFADARIAQSNVTQYQGVLSIGASQLTGTLADARVAQSNVTQHQSALAINATQVGAGSVDNTEFGYLNGVTSAIQTQLAGKSNTGHTHGVADLTSSASVPSAANTIVVRGPAGEGYFNNLNSQATGTNVSVTAAQTGVVMNTTTSGTTYGYVQALVGEIAVSAGQTNGGYIAGILIDALRSRDDDLGTLGTILGMRLQYGHYQSGATGSRTTTAVSGITLIPYVGMGTINQIFGVQVIPQQAGGASVAIGYGLYMAPFGATAEWGIYQTSPGTQRNLMGATLFGSSTSQFASLVTARDSSDSRRNSFEWGHPNTSGYGNTIGFENSSGTPYVCFYCSAGTNANTYKTWGNKGAVLSAATGHLTFGRLTGASADNQAIRVDGAFQDNGEYVVYNNILSTNSSGDKGFITSSAAVTTFLISSDGSGGYGIMGTASNHPLWFRIASANKMYLSTDSFYTQVPSNSLGVTPGTAEVYLDLGSGRTGSGASYIDLVGDAFYTDYGLRLIRSAGGNGTSSLVHRGTGYLIMELVEAGAFAVYVGGAEKMVVSSGSTAVRDLAGSGTAHVCADSTGVLSRCP